MAELFLVEAVMDSLNRPVLLGVHLVLVIERGANHFDL